MVPPVIRLTAEEKKERQRAYFMKYYERNKDKFKKRFQSNGANKRYYERNKDLKIDQNRFRRFLTRLESPGLNSLNPQKDEQATTNRGGEKGASESQEPQVL